MGVSSSPYVILSEAEGETKNPVQSNKCTRIRGVDLRILFCIRSAIFNTRRLKFPSNFSVVGFDFLYVVKGFVMHKYQAQKFKILEGLI